MRSRLIFDWPVSFLIRMLTALLQQGIEIPLEIAMLRNLTKQESSTGCWISALYRPRCRPEGDVDVDSFHDWNPRSTSSWVISHGIAGLSETHCGRVKEARNYRITWSSFDQSGGDCPDRIWSACGCAKGVSVVLEKMSFHLFLSTTVSQMRSPGSVSWRSWYGLGVGVSPSDRRFEMSSFERLEAAEGLTTPSEAEKRSYYNMYEFRYFLYMISEIQIYQLNNSDIYWLTKSELGNG